MQIPALDQEVLIIIGIVAAVVILALIVLAVVMATRRRKERERLKQRFGPEYDHAVKSEGSRKAVEDLHGRVEERESFSPIDPGEDTRSGLRRRMAALQYRFVDDPPDTMLETQRVVIDALRACGYPVAEDRERALKLLSVDHPEVTPSLRTLLEGSYGGDVGRMRTLFMDTKRALRGVVHVGYGPDDLGATPDQQDATRDPAREPSAHERPAAAGDRPTPADTGARPTPADTGDRPTPADTGDRPTPADTGDRPTPAGTGEQSMAGSGRPATGEGSSAAASRDGGAGDGAAKGERSTRDPAPRERSSDTVPAPPARPRDRG